MPGPWTFREHTAAHDVTDKPFEEAAFLERFRNMLVREDGDALWLAQSAPREWFKQGAKFAVSGAPTRFGAIGFEVVSDADHGRITATVEMPDRNPPKSALLRFRHPHAWPIKSVAVNGKPWTSFDRTRDLILLDGLTGKINIQAEF